MKKAKHVHVCTCTLTSFLLRCDGRVKQRTKLN